MKTRDDFQLDNTPSRSIKDIVLEQISYTEHDGKSNNPFLVESVQDLLNRIYKHIESEAIKRYKSNELWAVKAWTFENILQDSAAKEAAMTDDSLLDELVSPIGDWQKAEFDPLSNFKRKLTLSERKPGYIKECMRVATRVVSKYGKKQSYNEVELLEFLGEEHKRYKTSSYITRVRQLKKLP